MLNQNRRNQNVELAEPASHHYLAGDIQNSEKAVEFRSAFSRKTQMGNVSSPATSEYPKELLSLCRTGRLYDVEKWIAAGKPLELPAAKNRKTKTLLQIAVETGFHSMVDLIAKHEHQPVIQECGAGGLGLTASVGFR